MRLIDFISTLTEELKNNPHWINLDVRFDGITELDQHFAAVFEAPSKTDDPNQSVVVIELLDPDMDDMPFDLDEDYDEDYDEGGC